MQWQIKPLRVLESLLKLHYNKNWCFAPILGHRKISSTSSKQKNAMILKRTTERSSGLDLKQVVLLLVWINVTKTGIRACVLIIRSWQKKIKETFTVLLVQVVTSILKEAFISFRAVAVSRLGWMCFNLQVPLFITYLYQNRAVTNWG